MLPGEAITRTEFEHHRTASGNVRGSFEIRSCAVREMKSDMFSAESALTAESGDLIQHIPV